MRVFKFIPSALLFLAVAADANAAPKRQTVTCPVIASKGSKTFQGLSSRDFVCFRNASSARAAGYKEGGKIFVGSKFQAEESFSLDGSGDSNSPVFQVRNHSALVSYSFTGTGNFDILLIDQTTGRIVDRLVSIRGSAESSSYINTPGLFYLKISGSAAKADDDSSWSVSVETNAL